MRLLLAIRAFWLVLIHGDVAARVSDALMEGKTSPQQAPAAASPVAAPAAKTAPPRRSDALNLLATLQREARFVDFIQEPLGGYTDAQVGAAARQVHDDCRQVLGRLFGLRPTLERQEGDEIEVPAGFDAGRFRVTGNVAGEPPYRGRLVHPGWEAAHCQVPAWSGSAEAARVVAPAEVELP